MKKLSPQKNERSRPSDKSAYRMGTTRPQKRDIEYIRPAQRRKQGRSVLRFLVILSCIAGFLFFAHLDGSVSVIADSNSAEEFAFIDAVGELERKEEYISVSQDVLGSSLLNRSKISVSTSAIQSRLLEDFPELQGARVYTRFFSRSVLVDIKLREPRFALSLTSDGAPALNNQSAYLVDSNGYVMAATSVGDTFAGMLGELDIVPIEDQVTSSVTPGERVFSSDTVWFIEEFKRQLNEKDHDIDRIVFPVAANDIHVYIAGEKYYVKLDTSGDVRQQAGAFVAAIRDASTSSPREYIDVRVSGRVFIK